MTENKRFGCVFFTILEDGTMTDKGIVDGMLENEDAITEQLVRAGVIRRIVVGNKKPIGKAE